MNSITLKQLLKRISKISGIPLDQLQQNADNIFIGLMDSEGNVTNVGEISKGVMPDNPNAIGILLETASHVSFRYW